MSNVPAADAAHVIAGSAVVTTHTNQGWIARVEGWFKVDPTDETLPQIVEVFGGEEAFDAIPELDLEAATGCSGGTGYIDYIEPENMTAPVMKGTDQYGRPFVAVRFSDGVDVKVECFFRRYTVGSTWTSGGSATFCSSRMTLKDMARIHRLVNGEKVGHTHWRRFYNEEKEAMAEFGIPSEMEDFQWKAFARTIGGRAAEKMAVGYEFRWDAKEKALSYETGELKLV